MRVGINWIFGVPVGPTAPQIVSPEHAQWLATIKELAGAAVQPAAGASAALATTVPPIPAGLNIVGTVSNPKYAQLAACGGQLQAVPEELARKTLEQWVGDGREIDGDAEWPALLRRVDRQSPGYQN